MVREPVCRPGKSRRSSQVPTSNRSTCAALPGKSPKGKNVVRQTAANSRHVAAPFAILAQHAKLITSKQFAEASQQVTLDLAAAFVHKGTKRNHLHAKR
jgi:hypothetical protein